MGELKVKDRYEPIKNPPLHRGVAIFHNANDFAPIIINPVNILKITISNSRESDTMVYYGRNEYVYVSEGVREAAVIWANALNGTTDWEGVDFS